MPDTGNQYERGTEGRNPGFDAFNAILKMRQSPTGNQLTLDGNLVIPIYDGEPADYLLSPPNGTVVLHIQGNQLKLYGYSRITGWSQL